MDVNEDWELSYWSQRFCVSPDKLKETVKRVGVSVDAVEKALKPACPGLNQKRERSKGR